MLAMKVLYAQQDLYEAIARLVLSHPLDLPQVVEQLSAVTI